MHCTAARASFRSALVVIAATPAAATAFGSGAQHSMSRSACSKKGTMAELTRASVVGFSHEVGCDAGGVDEGVAEGGGGAAVAAAFDRSSMSPNSLVYTTRRSWRFFTTNE